jgi:hypothetical protein
MFASIAAVNWLPLSTTDPVDCQGLNNLLTIVAPPAPIRPPHDPRPARCQPAIAALAPRHPKAHNGLVADATTARIAAFVDPLTGPSMLERDLGKRT